GTYVQLLAFPPRRSSDLDGAQGGLGDLADGEQVVLDVDDGARRVFDLEVDHRVHPDGHVVPGDAFLRGHRHGDDLQVDLPQVVHHGDDHGQAGAAHRLLQPAEAEHHAPLVLLDDFDAAGEDEDDQCGED